MFYVIRFPKPHLLVTQTVKNLPSMHTPLFLGVNVTSLEHPPLAIVFLKSIIVAGTALLFSISLITTYIIL